MTMGYGTILADTPSAWPSGIAIFGIRQNGVLVTEAGVPAARLSRRDFAAFSPQIVHTHLFKADVAGAAIVGRRRTVLVSTKHNEDRYLAGEGFLPGYNFPRLPLRVLLSTGQEAKSLDRPRFIGPVGGSRRLPRHARSAGGARQHARQRR